MSKIKISSHGIRSALGMSQSEFAHAFGIPIGTVRNWDSKDCMPYYVFRLFCIIIDYVPVENIDNINRIEELKFMFNENEDHE